MNEDMNNNEKKAVLVIDLTEKIQVTIKVKEDDDSVGELQELFDATKDIINGIVNDIKILNKIKDEKSD